MESTYPDICSASVHFEDTICLYGFLMFSFVAMSISCDVLIKLSSVVCVLALEDKRWLSLCSFGKA